jgi:hypothetical protein
MPAFFFIDLQREVVFSRATGPVSYGDLAAHVEQLRDHPDFRPEFGQLCDVRHASDIRVSALEVARLAGKTVFCPTAKRAMVVSSEFQFGMARMLANYLGTQGEHTLTVFRQMPKALSWLGLSDEPEWDVLSLRGAVVTCGSQYSHVED